MREGSLDAPTRHPLDWRNPAFYDEAALDKELERVFDLMSSLSSVVSMTPASVAFCGASAPSDSDRSGQT